MSIIQRRNDEDASLHGADQFQNNFESLHECLGDFGIFNGQFEVASQRTGDNRPEGWEVNADAAGSVVRVTGGVCGNWCMRGGRVGAGTGGDIVSLRYIPVYEVSQGGRDYYVACAFKSDNGVGDARLGVHCYTAAKAFIATVWAVSVVNVGAGWVWYQRKVGPNGDVALAANTRYVRVVVDLQYDVAATDYIYCDDVQFQQMKMAYSPGIRLMHGTASDAVVRAFTLQAWTLYTNSTINLALEAAGHIWCAYNVNWVRNATAARANSWAVQIYIDGAPIAPVLGQTHSSWVINGLDGFCLVGVSAVAAGAHTISLRLWVVNAGDTIEANEMRGYAFYTRQF